MISAGMKEELKQNPWVKAGVISANLDNNLVTNPIYIKNSVTCVCICVCLYAKPFRHYIEEVTKNKSKIKSIHINTTYGTELLFRYCQKIHIDMCIYLKIDLQCHMC